jgi:hypothetical protein
VPVEEPSTASNSEVELADADFRFTPQSRHPADGRGGPLSANIGSRSSSVNDLVGAQQDCFRDGHPEGFRDL